MFCYLEQIELKVDHCPVRCIYRDKAKKCGYQKLTPDTDAEDNEIPVTTQQISDVKGIKLYLVKTESARARQAIRLGLLILKYAEYIKAQKTLVVSDEIREFVEYRTKDISSTDLTGDEGQEYEKVENLLLSTFGLGFEHRQMFHDPKIFKAWCAASNIEDVKLNELIEAMVNIPSPSPPKTMATSVQINQRPERQQ